MISHRRNPADNLSYRFAQHRPQCLDMEHIEYVMRELGKDSYFVYFYSVGAYGTDAVGIHLETALGHVRDGNVASIFVEVLDTDNAKHYLPVAAAAMLIEAKAYPLFWRIFDRDVQHCMSWEQQQNENSKYHVSELS